MSSEEPPVVEEVMLVFKNGSTGSQTAFPNSEMADYDDMVAMCASAIIDAMATIEREDMGEVEQTEFIKDVVNDYNRRKKFTTSEVVGE